MYVTNCFGLVVCQGEDRTADNFILPVRKPLAEVLDSVGMYLEARLLCKHMHLLKQQELLLVLKGFYTKKELTAFFPHRPASDNVLRNLSWKL